MKTGKRIASVVLMIMMLVTMALPALGADVTKGTNDNSGKITITNAVTDQSYTIYQILKLESWDEVNGAYAYKATDEWNGFVNEPAIKDVYLAVDTQGYVTWIAHNLKCTKAEHTHDDTCGGEGTCKQDEHEHISGCYYTKDEEAANFAKLAKKYADENPSIITTKTPEEATSATVEFENLNLGYYLIDTTLGTLCALDTTDNEVSVTEKNVAPTIKKSVYEEENLSSSNDADIGEEVSFLTTINAKKGADSYILHDKMDEGLTFNGDIAISDDDGELSKDTDYTVVTTNLSDGCTFEISFTKDYLDTITEENKLYVTYTAKLNKDAVVGEAGNKNETWLTYGDNETATAHSITKTYTWDLEVFKYTGEDTPLDGAKFVLYKKTTEDGGGEKVTYYHYYKKDAETGAITWEKATTEPKDIDATKVNELGITSINPTGDSCIAEIKGLDADVYYLHEYVAPNGYNILNEDVEVKILSETDSLEPTKLVWEVDQNGVKLTKTVEEEQENGSEPIKKTVNDNVVKVLNNTGTELPATGGIGTTIFYCAGAALTLGALVLLITKKRMQKQ